MSAFAQSRIRLLNDRDSKILEEFLAPHKSRCMFICSNLNAVGVEYKDAFYHGQYYGHFKAQSNILDGVIVHYWNGNLMMFSLDETVLESLISAIKHNLKRPIAGVIGPDHMVELVLKKLELYHHPFNLNSCEGLYQIKLANLKTPKAYDNFSIVEAKDVSRTLLEEWMQNYEVEALGAPRDAELKNRAETKVDRLVAGDSWALIDRDIPVALSGFNARVPGLIQIGPVWTPPEHRNKGYARFLLFQILNEERDRGTNEAILFTDSPPAIKAYESIGFRIFDHYRLALLKTPLDLRLNKN